jgi:hypothetical protein
LAWEEVEELSVSYNDQKLIEKGAEDRAAADEQRRLAAREREYEV